MCAWAYQARLEEKKSAANKGSKATKDKAAGGGTPPNTTAKTLTADQLAARRVERLAEVKQAGESPTEPPTITQEIAKVFSDTAKPERVMLAVDPATLQAMCNLDVGAKAVVESIKAEALPASRPLLSPEDLLDTLLMKSAEYKTDLGKDDADTALATTQSVLATMRSGGSDSNDELLLLMEAREKKQLAVTAKMAEKAPSQELRKETLATTRQVFVKQLQAQADYRAKGAAKAEERAAARHKQANEILKAAQALVKEVEEAKTKLQQAHTQSSELKRVQGTMVLEIIDTKMSEMEVEEVNFLDAVDRPRFLDSEPTATETERDEARRLSSLLEKQLHQLKEAATAAEATAALQPAVPTPTPAAVAEPWGDLHLDFPAEPSQLPSMENAPADLKEAAARVNALLQVVPWGCPLPAVQFEHLQILPAAIHTLVGDVIWQACWGNRQVAITTQHAVPYKLLNIIKSVVEKMAPAVTDAHRTTASEIYKAAMQRTENRRSSGQPY